MDQTELDQANQLDHIVMRLNLWASRDDHGFARVTFSDQDLQRQARDQVHDFCRQHHIPWQQIDLNHLDRGDLIQALIREIEPLKQGVCSIDGFAGGRWS